MAKVYKVEMYIVDANGDYDFLDNEEMVEEIEHQVDVRMDVMSHVTSVQSSKEFEWDDDLAVNKTNATIEDYEAQLKKEE
ncbi:hypothetical protein Blue_008 [Bacillus phage Deep Blue]|uniref:Uncharacterized protein n=1 Tax=Bacillus phage Deep Blue TaxID=1792245 RepID=A0A140HLG9_9CAUD|nr:hypothetical protein Blue_008 [Bacillus phage Deep Blue]AMO25831.1 hypothetical protein Blue_008 [Bacillus phage Deep Blue]